MKVLIIGAAGMIGRKLTARLVRDGKLAGKAITNAHLVDVVAPQPPANAPFTVTLDAFDIAASYVASKLIAPRPDVIFLLASVVSGEAEADFDKGYAINLGGTHAIFEAIRREQALSGGAYKPRLIFHLLDCGLWRAVSRQDRRRVLAAPLTNAYGTQKAICELWLADYSRRGFFDGIGLRLPTICVRPGLPNKAASGFFSGIIREPLGRQGGDPAGRRRRPSLARVAPSRGRVPIAGSRTRTFRSWALAARSVLPGVSVTVVGEQIEALRAIAGDKTVALIRREPDETIIRIVAGWARDFLSGAGKKSSNFKQTPVFRP